MVQRSVEEQKRISEKIEREAQAAIEERARTRTFTIEQLTDPGFVSRTIPRLGFGFVVPEVSVSGAPLFDFTPAPLKEPAVLEARAELEPVIAPEVPTRVRFIEDIIESRAGLEAIAAPEQIIVPERFEGVVQETVTMEQLERVAQKQAEKAELQRFLKGRLEDPVRFALGTGFPGTPPSAKFLEAVLTGFGAPLLTVVDPEVRAKTLEFLKKRPEELFKAAFAAPFFVPLVGAEITRAAKEEDIGKALGIGFTAATITGAFGAVGKAGRIARGLKFDFGPAVTGRPGMLVGAVRPRRPAVRLKLKKPKELTEAEFRKFQRARDTFKPQPPKITKVVREGNVITVTVESGGKVIDKRRFVEGVTDPSLIAAQLNAAKLQGARFVNIKAPTTVEPLSLSGLLQLGQLRQATRQRQVQLQEQRISQAITSAALEGIGVTQAQRQRQREEQRQITALAPALAQREAQRQAQAQLQGLGVASAQAQAQFQAQLEAQATAQASAQAQAEAQAEAQLSAQAARVGLRTPIRARPKPRPRLAPVPLLFPGEPEPSKKRIKAVPGYDAFVKVRGRVRKLTERPRTKTTALSIGAIFTDNSPAASFTIRKAGKPAQGAENLAWNALKGKFRERRTKTALELVEKAQFRIDTPGELRGITQKGIDVRRAL